ncbi:MAG TPA: hypothetical protein VHX43_19310 [Xanthobacteraceae bacterium]|jgi:hypothetical protein|nr:hypothetical protein [Xanthobacteraceae bacterium]
MMENSKKRRQCFVIGPIGAADSDARVHADWLLEEIIEPVFATLPDFEVIRSDKISQPGMIDAQIIQHLFEADLVIADLSKLNPNAFYEIGIRHMHQRPIIHMQLADDEIPFDISLYRAIKFSRVRPSDLRKARDDLKRAVEATFSSDYKVDNPITRARGQIKLAEDASPSEKVFLEQLRGIEYRLDRIENHQSIDGRPSVMDDSDDFYTAMKFATTITLEFPSDVAVSGETLRDVVTQFPAGVVEQARVSKSEIVITTKPGFMVTPTCDRILELIRSKYKTRTTRYSH